MNLINSNDGFAARWTGVVYFLIALGQAFAFPAWAQEQPAISGEAKLWHRVTLTWQRPEASETDTKSPFLQYRLDVTFEHDESEEKIVVPGFFAADGNAGESSAAKGNCWRVHFSPYKSGRWSYRASMMQGDHIAVTDAAKAAAIGINR